jgi:hypothetical protein
MADGFAHGTVTGSGPAPATLPNRAAGRPHLP